MTWKRALSAEQLAKGDIRTLEIDDESLLICRLDDGSVHAVANRCSHDGGILGETGGVQGTIIECPRHGARFDVRDGSAVRMPAIAPIEAYDARVTADGWIEVDLEDEED